MRWSICKVCEAEEDTVRADHTIVKMHECWTCWEDYCELHGLERIRICTDCVKDAYKMHSVFQVSNRY